jgi:hypothetical protein
MSFLNQNYVTSSLLIQRIKSKLNIPSLMCLHPLSPNDNTKNCYINLGENHGDYWNYLGDWRYLFRLLKILDSLHVNIFLPDEVINEIKLSSYSQCLSFYKIYSLKTKSSSNEEFHIQILPFIDSQDTIKTSIDSKIKNIYIHLDGSANASNLSCFRGDIVRVPFGIHPKIAVLNSYKYQRNKLQQINKRNIRILNSCSRGDIYHDKIILDSSLHLTGGRNRLLSVVYEELEDNNHVILRSPNLFWNFFSRSFSETKLKLVSLDHNRLFSEWLFTLALSDTYLCLPGRCLITCHNVYEAMSVGTIPILQYKNWFNPPLEDGLNCFSFQDEHDIVSVIREVLNTPKVKIEEMRKNVTDYYENHLSEQSLIRRIFNSSNDTLLLLDSEWNTDKIRKESIIFNR